MDFQGEAWIAGFVVSRKAYCVQGGDKTSHWNAGGLLSEAA